MRRHLAVWPSYLAATGAVLVASAPYAEMGGLAWAMVAIVVAVAVIEIMTGVAMKQQFTLLRFVVFVGCLVVNGLMLHEGIEHFDGLRYAPAAQAKASVVNAPTQGEIDQARAAVNAANALLAEPAGPRTTEARNAQAERAQRALDGVLARVDAATKAKAEAAKVEREKPLEPGMILAITIGAVLCMGLSAYALAPGGGPPQPSGLVIPMPGILSPVTRKPVGRFNPKPRQAA